MKKIKLIAKRLKSIKNLIFIGAIILLCTMKQTAHSQTLANDPLYQLVFSDEFDSVALNTNKWAVTWPWGPNIPNSNWDPYVCNGAGMDIAYNFLDLRLKFEKPSKELCKAVFYYAGYLFIHKIFEISSDLSQLEIPADIVRLFKMPAFPDA